jgi:hypothetical protein
VCLWFGSTRGRPSRCYLSFIDSGFTPPERGLNTRTALLRGGGGAVPSARRQWSSAVGVPSRRALRNRAPSPHGASPFKPFAPAPRAPARSSARCRATSTSASSDRAARRRSPAETRGSGPRDLPDGGGRGALRAVRPHPRRIARLRPPPWRDVDPERDSHPPVAGLTCLCGTPGDRPPGAGATLITPRRQISDPTPAFGS